MNTNEDEIDEDGKFQRLFDFMNSSDSHNPVYINEYLINFVLVAPHMEEEVDDD